MYLRVSPPGCVVIGFRTGSAHWETSYTLFQAMTLESWSMGIARPVHCVIIDTTQAGHDADKNRYMEDQHIETRAQIAALADEARALKSC